MSVKKSLKYTRLIGTGGIGTGIFMVLEGNETLGRNESRLAARMPYRDYCKLHIISHYVARLLGAAQEAFQVYAIGKVGEDEAGRAMLQEMRSAGIDVAHVTSTADAPTLLSVCFQYPDSTGGNITTSNSASMRLTSEEVNNALNMLGPPDGIEMALAAPEVPVEARLMLLRQAKARGAFTAASLLTGEVEAFDKAEAWRDIDLLAVNIDEAAAIAGLSSDMPSEDIAIACAQALWNKQPNMRVAVTDGPRGCYACEQGMNRFIPAIKVRTAATGGAGDAFLAGMLVGIALGLDFMPEHDSSVLSGATGLGTLLAAYSVTSPHTIHPDVKISSLLCFAKEHGAVCMESILERLM